MRRVPSRRDIIIITCAGVLGGAIAARGEDAAKDPIKSYEPANVLYAATELGLSGTPLWSKLFSNGWPTTKEYRRLTLDESSGAFKDAVETNLGSGLGLPLSASSWERVRADVSKKAGEAGMRDRINAFAKISGFNLTSNWDPTFLPYRKGLATFARTFSEGDPTTWTLATDGADKVVDMRAVGLTIWSGAVLADQELGDDRMRPDLFLACVGLETSVAAMNELRSGMMVEGDRVCAAPAAAGFDARKQKVYFPHLLTPQLKAGKISWEAVKGDGGKSRLADQATLLLGLSQLSLALDPAKLGKLGQETSSAGKKDPPLFDKDLQTQAAELATVVLESSRTIHVDQPSQHYMSIGTPDESRESSIAPDDVALYLLGLETYIQAIDKLGKGAVGFIDKRKRAVVLAEELGGMLGSFQAESVDDAFYEAYSFPSVRATSTNVKPLGVQGMAVRGLLAASRIAGGKQDLVDRAVKTLRYVEKTRWSDARHAYLESPTRRGPQKMSAADVAAVLGALRDAALATGDVRYLGRYREYHVSLRAAGFMRSMTSRQGTAPADGGSGVKLAGAAGVAPCPADPVFKND